MRCEVRPGSEQTTSGLPDTDGSGVATSAPRQPACHSASTSCSVRAATACGALLMADSSALGSISPMRSVTVPGVSTSGSRVFAQAASSEAAQSASSARLARHPARSDLGSNRDGIRGRGE